MKKTITNQLILCFFLGLFSFVPPVFSGSKFFNPEDLKIKSFISVRGKNCIDRSMLGTHLGKMLSKLGIFGTPALFESTVSIENVHDFFKFVANSAIAADVRSTNDFETRTGNLEKSNPFTMILEKEYKEKCRAYFERFIELTDYEFMDLGANECTEMVNAIAVSAYAQKILGEKVFRDILDSTTRNSKTKQTLTDLAYIAVAYIEFKNTLHNLDLGARSALVFPLFCSNRVSIDGWVGVRKQGLRGGGFALDYRF